MDKIVFAINHREAEEQIAERIKDQYLVAAAATYREAVITKINETNAHAVLVRDTLPGSMSFETLLRRLRVDFPNVRVIVICSERPKQDPFLEYMVGLGIYDIINNNKPKIPEIASYILTPRTYRDVAQYGIGLPDALPRDSKQETEQPEPEQKKKNPILGFGADVKKGFQALRKPKTLPADAPSQPSHKPASPTSSTPDIPQVDLDLLRHSTQLASAKANQEEMDSLIRNAVDRQTLTLQQEITRLTKDNEKLMDALSLSEEQTSRSIAEVNTIRSQKDALQVDYDNLRSNMEKGFAAYEDALKGLQDETNTPKWYNEQELLWDQQKKSLNEALDQKTREARELSSERDLLVEQVKANNQVIHDLKEQLQTAIDRQLSDKGADDLIFRLRAEISEGKESLIQKEKELKTVQEELAIAREGGPDYSYPLVEVPLLPDDTIYKGTGKSPQTILMVGSKHGVGNTTIAMNIAASIASRGMKTLLVEVNGAYPMTNQFFEFTHVPYGIDEAISSVADGDNASVDRAIIRPHGLRPTQKNLYKTYKMLPPGMHIMTFSNQSLINRHYYENHALNEATIYTLLSYLTKRQQYSHILLDIQCDDRRMIQAILNSGFSIDQIIMTLTQDSHAVATAGQQITFLSRAHASSLIASAEFIINRFNPNASITQQKIEKMLQLGSSQITRLSEDSAGYLNAGFSGLPYYVNHGRFWTEYDGLYTKLIQR